MGKEGFANIAKMNNTNAERPTENRIPPQTILSQEIRSKGPETHNDARQGGISRDGSNDRTPRGARNGNTRKGGSQEGVLGYPMLGYPQRPEEVISHQRRGNKGKKGDFTGKRMHTQSSRGADNTGGPKSTIVDDLREQLGKQLELRDIRTRVSEFSLDQHGSRFIQGELDSASTSDKDALFDELLPDALRLMTDVFGNYVVQKLIQHGSKEQCEALGRTLTGRVVELSFQMYGCRVIQKALERVTSEQQAELISELRPDGVVLECVKDQTAITWSRRLSRRWTLQ